MSLPLCKNNRTRSVPLSTWSSSGCGHCRSSEEMRQCAPDSVWTDKSYDFSRILCFSSNSFTALPGIAQTWTPHWSDSLWKQKPIGLLAFRLLDRQSDRPARGLSDRGRAAVQVSNVQSAIETASISSQRIAFTNLFCRLCYRADPFQRNLDVLCTRAWL